MQYLTDLILDENLELEPKSLFRVVCRYLQYEPQELRKALPKPKYSDYIDFKANWGDEQIIQIWATQINVDGNEAHPPEIVGTIELTHLVGQRYRVTMTFGQPTIVWDDESGEMFNTNNPRYVQVLRNQGVHVQTYDTVKILELVFFYLSEYIIHVFKGEPAVDDWKRWLSELKLVDIELPYRKLQQLVTTEAGGPGEKSPKPTEPQQPAPAGAGPGLGETQEIESSYPSLERKQVELDFVHKVMHESVEAGCLAKEAAHKHFVEYFGYTANDEGEAYEKFNNLRKKYKRSIDNELEKKYLTRKK